MFFNALLLIALVGLAVYLLVFIRLREKKFLNQASPPSKSPAAQKDTKFAQVLAARDRKKSS